MQIWVKLKVPVENVEYVCQADKFFDNSLTIEWQGNKIYLFGCPGHSLGSSCVLVNDKILFSGDSLFKDYPTVTGLPGGSKKGWLEKSSWQVEKQDVVLLKLVGFKPIIVQGIGKRTSRIGYAESLDGITMTRDDLPVLFPAEDTYKDIEWEGGCEDPRVAMTEDGTYVMLYTAWNRNIPRLAVAVSKDLKKWTKHGLAFAKAYNGRFADLASKSASIVTGVKDGKLVIEKINGKYFMYWGEKAVYAATSDNLIDWEPVLDENNELRKIAVPRAGYFDSRLTECGPPAIKTVNGIVLLYNGKNGDEMDWDPDFPEGAYCAGQFLFDANDPYKVLDRLDKPFFVPEAAFEKSGQYKDGTVFIEGLAYLKNKLYLYYGCADSQVAVAVCDDNIDSKL